MIRLALLYPVLCFVLMGAHLLFHGYGLAVALLTLIPAALLFVRNRRCALACAVLLLISGLEWAYTAYDLALTRQAYGQPWIRSTAIVAGCGLAAWLAAAMLLWRRLDDFYKR